VPDDLDDTSHAHAREAFQHSFLTDATDAAEHAARRFSQPSARRKCGDAGEAKPRGMSARGGWASRASPPGPLESYPPMQCPAMHVQVNAFVRDGGHVFVITSALQYIPIACAPLPPPLHSIWLPDPPNSARGRFPHLSTSLSTCPHHHTISPPSARSLNPITSSHVHSRPSSRPIGLRGGRSIPTPSSLANHGVLPQITQTLTASSATRPSIRVVIVALGSRPENSAALLPVP